MKFKYLGTIFVLLFMIFSVNALGDNPTLQYTIEVYNSSNVYQGQLSQLNNLITSDEKIKISLVNSYDVNDNNAFNYGGKLETEQILLVSQNSFTLNDLDYNNLNSIIGNRNSLYSNNDFSTQDSQGNYHQWGHYYSAIQLTSNTLPLTTDLQRAFSGFSSGNYLVSLKVKDSWGNTDYKYINLSVVQAPSPTSYNCNGNLVVSGSNVDVNIYDSCTNITLDSTATNVFFYYKGTSYSNNNQKQINLNIYGDTQSYSVLTNKVKFNIYATSSFQSELVNSNLNNYFMDLININDRLEITNHNGVINSSGTTLQIGFNNYNNIINNINTNNYYVAYMGQRDKVINGNYIFNYYNTLRFELNFFSAYDINNNNFTINSNSVYPVIKISTESSKLFFNSFNNFNHLNFDTQFLTNYVNSNIYGNKFKMNSNYDILIPSGGMMPVSGNITFGKNINNKYLGNEYLDSNGNDIYVCNDTLNNINYLGIDYKVCNSPILITTNGQLNIYDYIIVTDTNAGGQQPIAENKKPVGIIDVSSFNVPINTNINWNISRSYDTDGTIVDTKLYVDNVLYDNVNSGSFSSDTPKIITLKLIVTDDKGLTDTTYRTITITKPTNQCLGDSSPYGEIQATNLGNNNYNFEGINLFDGDGDNISVMWVVNDEFIQGNPITSGVFFNQSISMILFDGCVENVFTKHINSTINDVNGFVTPTFNLQCTQSQQTPISQMSCEINNINLNGGTLTGINWFYDGNKILSQENQTTFTTSINDINLHNLVATLTTSQSIKSEYYQIQLTQNPILITNTTNINNNSNTSSGLYEPTNIIGNSTTQTTDNLVSWVKGMSGGITSIAQTLGVFLFVILAIGGVINLIS